MSSTISYVKSPSSFIILRIEFWLHFLCRYGLTLSKLPWNVSVDTEAICPLHGRGINRLPHPCLFVSIVSSVLLRLSVLWGHWALLCTEPTELRGYYFPLDETAVIQAWSFSVSLAEISGLGNGNPAYMYTLVLFVGFNVPCNLVLFKILSFRLIFLLIVQFWKNSSFILVYITFKEVFITLYRNFRKL